jgi:hypothetical protein
VKGICIAVPGIAGVERFTGFLGGCRTYPIVLLPPQAEWMTLMKLERGKIMKARAPVKCLYYVSIAIWVFAALCDTSQRAYAYVDPGSGLFLLQIVSSTFLGFTFMVRKRIGRLINRLFRTESATTMVNEPR